MSRGFPVASKPVFWGKIRPTLPKRGVFGRVYFSSNVRMRFMDTVSILSQSSKMAGLPPRRIKNTERRPREYLLPQEVEALMEAARKSGRHGHRDATLMLLAYRHGLRRVSA